ncbi:hypothetical protein [Magnetospirillum sp. SS-4]|uniref:hypothetical protein n=1 Tax=Magnetospirillum sp. SS-4 TaxID=2681465 RepID=UPI001381B11D|nr:hypothetical protein [Magnetospirillum sp. SS-4]CAA7621060.1 conserved hypothetical protein [Magnetospirillum sp. SS-4]
MIDCIEAWRRRHEGRAIIVGKSVVAVALIAGCSWVPDAVNPVEWYKGVADSFSDDEEPEVASPRRPDGSFPSVNSQPAAATGRKELAKGLVADRDNSKYAEAVKREPSPTKQLARKTPPATTQTAQGVPSLDRPMATARDDGPQAPPQVAMGGPPPRPEIPETVPTRRSLLQDHYQQRLAQSAAATNKNDPFAAVPPSRPESSYNQPVHTYAVPAGAPVSYAAGYGNAMPAGHAVDHGAAAPQLIPPKGVKTARGAKGAVIPSGPAASFQVASVQFGKDGDLTESDRAALREVAQLQKRTGGVVRVLGLSSPGAVSFVGLSPEMVAGARARTVARTLASLGVPARKVVTASDSAGLSGGPDDSGARISIEY